MEVGIEGCHIPGFKSRSIFETLDQVKRLGADGVFVKTVPDLSADLDEGRLREIKAHADDLGLYLECGVGAVNPYNTAEQPHIRALGNGDYRRALERMIRAARTIECTELWACTAASVDKCHYRGDFVIDRFRTDVSWSDQLAATENFLRLLAPLLRDLGSRINIETHEDITSFEVVRLVEAVGPDVLGITFDTGNVLMRCEDPIAAAHRVAPFTRLTHIKDAILFFDDEGLVRQILPCGRGVIDWQEVISILFRHNPNLRLSIEDHKGLGKVRIFDRRWLDAHPDLRIDEYATLIRIAAACEKKIVCGDIADPAAYEAIPLEDQWADRLQQSMIHLRSVLRRVERA